MFPFWKQLEGQYSNISNTLKGEFVNTITHANRGRTEEILDTTTRVRKINGNSMDGLWKTRVNHILDVRKMAENAFCPGEQIIANRRGNEGI